MRALVLGVLVLLPGAMRAQDPSWTRAVAPLRIADDLYYVGTEGLGAYLFTSSEGHILLDATLADNAPLVLESIIALGFEPSDIRLLVASHAHFDHVGGLADLLEVTGATLLVSEADADFVRQGRDFGLDTPGYPPAAPVGRIGHLDSVRVGHHVLTAHVTPGHTPGCTTWTGVVTIDGVPLTFVVVCSLSVLPSYRLVGADATYPGLGREYCRSVAQLRGLRPDIFLAGHGGWFGLAEKTVELRAGNRWAFVEHERYPAYLDRASVAIERALADGGHVGGCATLIE